MTLALRVKVSARAAAQIRVGAAWWAENRAAAPGAFRNDIEDASNLLAHQPGRRALVETTMCCYTAPIWPQLRARLDAGRRTEAAVGAVVLNRILSVGRPNSVRSARGAT